MAGGDHVERLARVEARVEAVEESIRTHRLESAERAQTMHKKMDSINQGLLDHTKEELRLFTGAMGTVIVILLGILTTLLIK